MTTIWMSPLIGSELVQTIVRLFQPFGPPMLPCVAGQTLPIEGSIITFIWTIVDVAKVPSGASAANFSVVASVAHS